ncbi:hypothetical protein ATO12_15360 [Aquimarina atlantica]|uniref:Cadherin domain-containing protein n=1 Tax=Aquimarina atlantica TaxID=1317122 RepID=A0A023BW28_9FLAO|nr:cadherin domain-containing protein [Aquimarina atlantica]EZH74242.1 hypothetical protein ATO12_15360 [Aquimarina atlantica]
MKTTKFLLLVIAILALSCSKDDDQTINLAPVIKAQSFSASETAIDTEIFGTVTATDVNEDALSYSITANSDDLFEITKTGALSLASGKTLDFETKTTHEITVEVTDGKAKASAKVTITVTDGNDTPAISAQSFTAAETIEDTVVIGTVTATDENGDQITYSIITNSNDLFEITTTGELSLAVGKTLDFETKSVHEIIIEATDGNHSASETITINVSDITTVSTLAGGGPITVFNAPQGLVVDASGNVYVANVYNHTINKITPDGTVSVFAGSVKGYANGTGSAAKFHFPIDLAIDASDNIYVADQGNHCIRKITPGGVVSMFAGSEFGLSGNIDDTGSAARFNGPTGITVDANNIIYVTDINSHLIRKITPLKEVTTLAGSIKGYAEGTGTAAKFSFPSDVVADNSGNVYVTDQSNHRIRKITSSGVVTTFAGSSSGYAEGTGSAAQFNFPTRITIDPSGNLYVTDLQNHRIRKITSAGVVSTLAGIESGYIDGDASIAKFERPYGIAIDASLNLYVTDETGNRVRKITQ